VTAPAIPTKRFALRPERPRLIRLDGRELVFGMADDLTPGAVVVARRWTGGRSRYREPVRVRVGPIVYESTVRHPRPCGPVRYVVTGFTEIPD